MCQRSTCVAEILDLDDDPESDVMLFEEDDPESDVMLFEEDEPESDVMLFEEDEPESDVMLFEEDEPEESQWSEFSYSRYDKPTNRWATVPTEWELFMNEKIVY
jgi:hypothetical protein